MMNEDQQKRMDELTRMIYFDSTITLPDNKSKFTFRVDGELDDKNCDYVIEFFKLVKQHKSYRRIKTTENNA